MALHETPTTLTLCLEALERALGIQLGSPTGEYKVPVDIRETAIHGVRLFFSLTGTQDDHDRFAHLTIVAKMRFGLREGEVREPFAEVLALAFTGFPVFANHEHSIQVHIARRGIGVRNVYLDSLGLSGIRFYLFNPEAIAAIQPAAG